MITGKSDGQPPPSDYDEWLMEKMIGGGIGLVIDIPNNEWQLVQAAIRIGHMSGDGSDTLGKWEYKLTDKAKRYLHMLTLYDTVVDTVNEENE